MTRRPRRWRFSRLTEVAATFRRNLLTPCDSSVFRSAKRRCCGQGQALSSQPRFAGREFAGMKRRAVKSEHKPGQSRRPQPTALRAPTGKHAGADEPKVSRPPSRAVAMRLAAEVDALAAQLQDSRARIAELENRGAIAALT